MVSAGISQSNPRRSEFQETNPFLTMPTARVGQVARFVHTDKSVGRLGDFPELTQAVREGDVPTITVLCAELFGLNSRQNHAGIAA
jgi:hypothetical protein